MDAEKIIEDKKRVRFVDNEESKQKKIKTKPKTILLLSSPAVADGSTLVPPLAPLQPILKTTVQPMTSLPQTSVPTYAAVVAAPPPRAPFFRVEGGNPDF